MKARSTRRGDRGGWARPFRGLSSRTKALIVVTAVIGGALMNPFADAQPVGNPGSINFKIAGGNMHLGSQDFDLTPTNTTECNDGKNNDGSDPTPGSNTQDILIDFPADTQCSSALDNSEVQTGFQPKQDSTITGTVGTNGAVTVPTSGIFFPPIYQYQSDAVLTVQIVPTSAGTGTLNPLTGVAALSISLKLTFSGSPSGVSLGSSCLVGPFTLAMISGTTAPPAPNVPISGVPYDASTGIGTVVNNSFSVPGASGCGPLGLANSQLNTGLGVPAAAGTNTAILILEANPKIAKGVVASNVPSATTGLSPLTVNFNGTGSTAVKPITGYAWDFGNGQTATGSTAFTTYPTPGTFITSLTVTDSDGDHDTQTKVITVTEPPNVPPNAAIGSSGTGGIAPYTVSLDGSGSNDPDGSITSYSWDLGNGTATGSTATAVYPTPGTYTVTLTVTDNKGAIGTATKVITVIPKPNVLPNASITTVSVAGTIPLTVNLSGANSNDPDGTIAGYSWDLGNGQTSTAVTAQANYTVAGTYTIVLTVTDDQGGTGTAELTVDVSADSNIAPGADFSASTVEGVAPLAVIFDGSASSDVDGSIASYAWNFGNGQNGSGPTPPAVTYTLPGTYTARLTVTDNKGATGTSTKTITVSRPPNQSPVGNITPTPATGTAPLLVQLSSAGSTDPDGAITSYAWNFGNGVTSTSPSPAAVYNTAGTYTVTLTVTDNDGASAVKSVTVVVNAPNLPPVPVIASSSVTGSAPLLVTVNGAGSSDPDGSIVSYVWTFGNGQTAFGPTASTTYTSPGSYQITLTVVDNGGSQRFTNTTVVAGATNLRPIAAITALPTSGPAPLLVQLGSVGSSDPDGTITKYSWDFGNGQTGLGTATQVTYTTAGSFTVALTVTDNKGATTTATEQIVVDPARPITDRVRLQFTGSVNYTFDGPLTSGNLVVRTDTYGVLQVAGGGAYIGPHNSDGSVSVSLNRFLWYNAFSGSITVLDGANGVANVTTPLVLRSLSRPSATSVRGTASGSNAQFKPFTLSFTIDDRA